MQQPGPDKNQSPQGQEKQSPWQLAQERAQQAPADLDLGPSERMVGIGLLVSLIAGLIVGISARMVMRIVAVTAHLPLQFNIAATLNVVFIGLIIGFVAGIVYSACVVVFSNSPKGRKYLPGPVCRGLIFGVLFLVIIGLPNLLGPSSPSDDINLGNPLLNRCMFAALPLIYGMALGGAEAILDRYLPRKPASLDEEIKSPTQ